MSRFRGIPVGRTEDPEPVAELAVALTLAVGRRLIEATTAAKRYDLKATWCRFRGVSRNSVMIMEMGRDGGPSR